MSINEKKETGKFTDVPSYEEYARRLYHQEQYEAALVEYSRLLQEHPKDENLMIMIGNCWDGRGVKMRRRVVSKSLPVQSPISVGAFQSGNRFL